MPEKIGSDLPKYPTIEEFEAMSAKGKLDLWVSLPISVQKLLIAIDAHCPKIVPDANPRMVKATSRLTNEEFEDAKQVLSGTPFFSETETGRFKIVQPMKNFINTDLTRFWKEQENRDSKK